METQEMNAMDEEGKAGGTSSETEGKEGDSNEAQHREVSNEQERRGDWPLT